MPTSQLAMAQSLSQYPSGEAFFQFDLNAGDINLNTAPYIPDGFSLPQTKQEMDACSYVTSDEYNGLSPDVLPISQPPSISPASFASSGSASPEVIFQDRFGSFPDELFMHNQDAPAAPSAMTIPSTNTAMAAISLPSPSTAASNTPSPSSKMTEKTNSKATAATAANGKPRRKRPNRYQGASEELMQRRRDQNRHSQRAYRERKDQKIKDLEADVATKDRLISQLRSQLRSQQCMRCRGGDFPPPGRAAAPPPPPSLYAHNTHHMHHPNQRAPPPPPPPATVSYTHTQGPAGMPYRTAFLQNTQTALLPQTAPMGMVPPVPIGQAGHSSAAMYGIPSVAGAPSSL